MNEQETLRKCREIVVAIRDICNKEGRITFEEDWGDNSLTISFHGGHTHAGFPGGSEENLIDSLHDMFVENRGLSIVKNEPAKDKSNDNTQPSV